MCVLSFGEGRVSLFRRTMTNVKMPAKKVSLLQANQMDRLSLNISEEFSSLSFASAASFCGLLPAETWVSPPWEVSETGVFAGGKAPGAGRLDDAVSPN